MCHIIQAHIAHLFTDLPQNQAEYKCEDHNIVLNTRYGMITHLLLKHDQQYAEIR